MSFLVLDGNAVLVCCSTIASPPLRGCIVPSRALTLGVESAIGEEERVKEVNYDEVLCARSCKLEACSHLAMQHALRPAVTNACSMTARTGMN